MIHLVLLFLGGMLKEVKTIIDQLLVLRLTLKNLNTLQALQYSSKHLIIMKIDHLII